MLNEFLTSTRDYPKCQGTKQTRTSWPDGADTPAGGDSQYVQEGKHKDVRGGRVHGGGQSRWGRGTLEWGVMCSFQCGGEGALIRKVIFDLRPARGEEAHLADTCGESIPGRGKNRCKGPGA